MKSFLFVVILLLPLSIFADEAASGNNLIDQTLAFVSHGLWKVSSHLDQMLAKEENINDEDNNSQLLFKFSTTKVEGQTLTYVNDLQFKLDLPNTQKHFQLILEKSVDKAQESVLGKNSNGQASTVGAAATTIDDAVRENDYSLAMRYLIAESKAWQIYSDVGIKLKIPPNPFARFKIKRNIYFYDWTLSLSEKLFADLSSGLAENTTINLDRAIGKNMTFRFGNSADWREDSAALKYIHGFYLHHLLSEHHSFLYQLSTKGSSEDSVYLRTYMAGVKYVHFPWEKHSFSYHVNANGVTRYTPYIDNYDVGVAYKFLFYRDWWYLTLAPNAIFYKINNFAPIPSISLQVDVIFAQ
ncbi:MAG: hypothetical protein A2504_12650 [Bdellovibrionales bacterium RIFOXYD12_FULL_39_22]|nr:MAG: hypothetical protein A2385_03735 [Bdellovibrionales bacterium RIFOXYB1_FULL_39_21]OFZ40463.1 MAG: hypothetical protein A2485_02600 [Bdellovibrionales bacterium RIFOXYC12_FULL_39_17]OFZ49946.1 MAG: hypothetical protein A2404_01935 [Bdellovibrionales bacterium RIFOXYC1_FULL_39_130]OFZ68832.1 MAG: hypothetical protein A2451_11825 [Bdellovibrionales bacterium RIFOXYC2_FULL_39_8]OFZ77588.1 MAG: hypothetical protein A2560_04495 [Bdellovibrionales bacterium RIFOXYD1_FULL_39_84]OFZ96042.1 MAG: